MRIAMNVRTGSRRVIRDLRRLGEKRAADDSRAGRGRPEKFGRASTCATPRGAAAQPHRLLQGRVSAACEPTLAAPPARRGDRWRQSAAVRTPGGRRARARLRYDRRLIAAGPDAGLGAWFRQEW